MLIKRLVPIVAVLLLLIAVGFVIWSSTPMRPMPEAIAALQSDDQVTVETSLKGWLVFKSAKVGPSNGLVFYPGARVDPRAYAPAARAIAAQNNLVVIVPMPFNLAFFDPDRAAQVIGTFPTVHSWAVGGHSLGGAMAARFIYVHPQTAQGLVLWAAYPAQSDNLSSYNLAVVSIYGTRDGLATGDKIEKSRALLPANTRWVSIEGGNHAQFGFYGAQPGDGQATISREEQQRKIVAATSELVQSLSQTGGATCERHPRVSQE